jgi:hypothetical protein
MVPDQGVAPWDEFAPLKTVWVDNQPTERKLDEDLPEELRGAFLF